MTRKANRPSSPARVAEDPSLQLQFLSVIALGILIMLTLIAVVLKDGLGTQNFVKTLCVSLSLCISLFLSLSACRSGCSSQLFSGTMLTTMPPIMMTMDSETVSKPPLLKNKHCLGHGVSLKQWDTN